ncbi:AAA family ATPase [Bradyrhizobium sp. 14AA]
MSSAIDNSSARRSRNKKNAFQFAQVGLYVFPSDGKVPLIPRYNRADTSLSKADVEAAVEEFMEKHEVEPAHVGATRDIEVIKRMWRKFPDAVPSISCGPSKLVVLDADKKDDGPAKMAELFAEIGGVPEGVPVNPTKSGGQHFVFVDPESKFNNKAGLLKKQYGTDVRGQGGQFVGPGSIREDGKTYGSDADRLNFLRAITSGKIPRLPDEIVELIGAQSSVAQGVAVTPTQEREVIKRLEEADWEKYEHAFDANLGDYDLNGLLASNPELRSLYNAPGADCSTNRFLAARHIMREWPDLPVEALSIFFSSWEGAGEYTDDKPKSGQYDDRQIAREWIKNQGLTKNTPSDGSAFEAVDDDEDDHTELGDGVVGSKSPSTLFEMEHEVAAKSCLPSWLVEELIEEKTLAVVYGPPNSGKSLLLLDMLYHVAAGKKWRGREVRQGCVLFVALEGPNGTARRAKAWRAHHNIDDGDKLPLAFVRVGMDFYKSDKDAKRVVKAARELEKVTGLPCVAIAIDTLSAATPGMDQNSEMGTFVNRCRLVIQETKAAVLAVHHPGKISARGMRGDSNLLGSVDATILVEDGVAETQKMRDGRSGQKIRFKIGVVNLWADVSGKPVGAPVAMERDRGAALENVDGIADDERLVPPDTSADKVEGALSALRTCALRIADATGDRLDDIPIAPGKVFTQHNEDRKAAGLTELKDRSITTRFLAKLEKQGRVVRSGENRRTEYRLSG